MSRVVGKHWVRYGNSDETEVDVTCCEDARAKLLDLMEFEDNIRKVNNHFNPRISMGMVFVHAGLLRIPLNYCPVCGDKYSEEGKRK